MAAKKNVPKQDKDMGSEVNNLGGYRPNSDRLSMRPVASRYVEILIIQPGGGMKRRRQRHPLDGVLTVGPTIFDV